MMDPSPRKICQELDIPLIKVQKPVHWPKLSSSNSEDNTSVQSDSDPSQTQTTEDSPLAIPPRVPLAQDKSKAPGHNLMSIPRGGIALPQPTAEEWRSLRPSPPNPSASPIVLHRAGYRVPPPQPPKTGISVHSVKQAIKGRYKSKHAINRFSDIFYSERSYYRKRYVVHAFMSPSRTRGGWKR